ncbi:MAG: hypothetical protein OEV29_12900 [Thermoleophilia bacterium]|nr:hypothetical protein [Thermoleophilia bacterium]
MLVYVEYRSRNPAVDLAHFHAIVGRRTDRWADEFSEDILLLNAARTWRIGPEPEYLVIYYTPTAGLERLTAWEEIFMSGEAERLEAQTRATGRIDEAGCFFPLLEPVPAERGRYYIEYFDVASDAGRDDVTAFFVSRRDVNQDLTLHLVADRIGMLGPHPRGLAIWGIPGYDVLERIATGLDGVSDPIQLVRSGLYADIGEEIV